MTWTAATLVMVTAALIGCGTDTANTSLTPATGPAAATPAATAQAPVSPGAETGALTEARVATMGADEFWGATRSAASPAKLEELVRWGVSRTLHESVWRGLWAKIEQAQGAERAGLVAEAARLATAVEAVTGEGAYTTRIAEDARLTASQTGAGTPQESVRRRIAEARKVLTHFKKPEVARPTLVAARAEAEQHGLTAELAEIAELEALLLAPTKTLK